MKKRVITAGIDGFLAAVSTGDEVRAGGDVYAFAAGDVFVGCGTPVAFVGAVVEEEGPEEGGEDYYYGVRHDFCISGLRGILGGGWG